MGCKWIFRIKRHLDGSINSYKARLVAKGFHQRLNIDYQDTFSPVAKPTTMQLVFSIVVSRGWSPRQLDINNVFLQGHISEDICHNHQVLLIWIIHLIYAISTKQFMGLSKLLGPSILSFVNFYFFGISQFTCWYFSVHSQNWWTFHISFDLCGWHYYYGWLW